MSKSSGKLVKVLHFAIAFVVAWPLLIISTGAWSVHVYTQLENRCDYRQYALFNALYENRNPQATAFVIGRKGFIKAQRSESRESLVSLTGADEIVFVEIGKLNIPAAADLLEALAPFGVKAVVYESHPSVWTDYKAQNYDPQVMVDLVEPDYTVDYFYRMLRAQIKLISGNCEKGEKIGLPKDIQSASFYLDYETVRPEAREKLKSYAAQIPVFWIHDENYYLGRLKGSEDTLVSLRELPNRHQGSFGRIVVR